MSEESVKVAVRVRPFNSREKARNASLIIGMDGSTTTIADPENTNEEPRKFTFDFSYWSHDGFKEESNGYLAPTGPKYADQKRVFEDLGRGVMKNAWEGYNCSLFAYGQTGSGKSYSMVGYGVNKGIVPIFCEEIFKAIDEKKKSGDGFTYEVTFNMLEIYNEQVRDLLNPKSNKKGGLKVRQHPKKGFYAEGLAFVPVNSYDDINNRIEEGTRNRTVAATQMNATSSRAHTIVGISFTQKGKNAAGQETAKNAVINLVDLAGSERAESTGATGDRLKEGAAINQSLSTLGNVISALADNCSGKKVRVPYRDSVLTKLLKNALGGNSKTIMIAALSPADINYDETLSTLRYADRAKQIKTKAMVNEDPTDKLIRELKDQNAQLLAMLEKGGLDPSMLKQADDDDDQGKAALTPEEREQMRKEIEEELRAQMMQNEAEMANMETDWDKRVEASKELDDSGEKAKKEERKTIPHLYNLNVDSQLNGMIVHILKPGQYKVGNNKAEPTPEITLSGLSILKEHAVIQNEGGKVSIEKTSGDAKLLLNGEPVTAKEELNHNDRIMFGSSHLYLFQHPDQLKKNPKAYGIPPTYEEAQEEIAQKSGFDMGKGDGHKSKEDLLLQEDLIEMVPAVEEANAISEELDKKVKFEIVCISPKARGLQKGRTEVCVKMRNVENGLEYIWPRDKFFRRKYLMQEMYQNYQEGEDWHLPDEKDPFTESPDTEVIIGQVNLYLQSMAYMIEMKESLDISDYRGKEQGMMEVEIVPCSEKGKELGEDDDIFVDDPRELVGRSVNFAVKIHAARGIPNKYTDVFCKYKMFLEREVVKTTAISGTTNPEFNHRQFFSFKPATSQLVEYLKTGILSIQIIGKQKLPGDKKGGKKGTTKQIVMSEVLSKGKGIGSNEKTIDPDRAFHVFQLAVLKKKEERLNTKMAQFRRMLELADKSNKMRIQTEVVRAVLLAPSDKKADQAMQRIAKDSQANGGGGGAAQGGSNESAACSIL